MEGTLGCDPDLKVGDKYLCVHTEYNNDTKRGEVYTITHPEYINGRKASWVNLTRFTKLMTLTELGVKIGDVVESFGYASKELNGPSVIKKKNGVLCAVGIGTFQPVHESSLPVWKMVSRTLQEDKPKTWAEMTDAEKVVLLLAAYEGKEIEFQGSGSDTWTLSPTPRWSDWGAYRIKPVPVIKTITMQMHHNESGKPHIADHMSNPTHCIKYNTLDGEVDTSSIKMEEL
tara:strand:+ start:106 stop:795 length:690 start_codon:yes stop_codon:yes gene_type:complete